MFTTWIYPHIPQKQTISLNFYMFYKLQSIVEIDRIYTVAQGKIVFVESIDVH
jgi:hypothetical protein